ncbi:MAG: TonB-dependent receptor plug domain-containing protein [Terriglobales bacterium]
MTVLDSQAARIHQARVVLYADDGSTTVAVGSTSVEGIASFHDLKPAKYGVEVLAPGFALQTTHVFVDGANNLEIRLAIAGHAETVIVSATRTPLPANRAASTVVEVSAEQLTNRQPVAAGDAVRFVPGVVVADAGRRGGLTSMFVRGGESRYNKVIVDGVPVNDPGGSFNFGVVPMAQVDRVELVRGAASSLYGSDAMTSVVQIWTRSGTTPIPELRLGAEGGNFNTARGYGSLSGARGRLSYNFFGQQFNTDGSGVNDAFSNSSEGLNVRVQLSSKSLLRITSRHSTAWAGVQSYWNYNGNPLLAPDSDEYSRQNDFLAGAEISISPHARWQHRFAGFESNVKRYNIDQFADPGRISPVTGGSIDYPFKALSNLNRAGFDYQGEFLARSWAQTAFGYHFENENGWVGELTYPPLTHGLRRNHEAFVQQVLAAGRASLIAGARFVHNESFGNKVVPRVAASFLLLRGGQWLSGTRIRAAYSTGIKEPRLEESFANNVYTRPNPNLKAEENRSWEAGVEQGLAGGRYQISALYYHNLFRRQITYASDPITWVGQYVNLDSALAHGAEVEFHGQPLSNLQIDGGYTYTATQILNAAFPWDPLVETGRPLLRRPKHMAVFQATWSSSRWGANLSAIALGRRLDVGLFPGGTYSAGYGRVDVGFWRVLSPRLTAYANVENAFDRDFEGAAGYPALGANFRVGIRIRVGGE